MAQDITTQVGTTQDAFDFVIPLFKVRWNTRAVLEGLSMHYQPRSLHIITPGPEARSLQSLSQDWTTAPLHIHEEETFFPGTALSKEAICAEFDVGQSLYTPGWFYQQLLKLGSFEGIEGLSEWYMVWDSDLLPSATWPLLTQEGAMVKRPFALLQHNQWGNPDIVSKWDKWIYAVLGVPAVTDQTGTFIPHHMWFKQEHLKSFARQINRYYESTEHWLLLMMRSANEFGTFSEYWAYVSWVAEHASEDLAFHPYESYGETTERFFDDGTGMFSTTLRKHLGMPDSIDGTLPEQCSPSYVEVDAFIRAEYGLDNLPSSIAFESSPRHLKKNEKTMHIEERRSRWNPRMAALTA